jgi:hypothetical protein
MADGRRQKMEIDWKARAKRAEALLERYVRERQPGFGTKDRFYEDARSLLVDKDQEDARVWQNQGR